MKKYDWLTVRKSRSVGQLHLWNENPRLNPDLKYATLHSFTEGICGDKGDRDAFITLMESIVDNGFIPADPIVVWQNEENKKYYVAEGNRRVLALKLLLSPDKSPISIQAKVSTLAKKISDIESIKKIKVAIAPTLTEAEWYISQRHSTAALLRKWSREQQFRYIARIFAEENCDAKRTQLRTQLPVSEVNGIIRILKLKEYILNLEKEFTSQEFENFKSYQFPISTFERFLEDTSITEKLRIQYDNENIHISSKKEDFNAALIMLVKGICSDREGKITSRTKTEDVSKRIPEPEEASTWNLENCNFFQVSTKIVPQKAKPQNKYPQSEIGDPRRQHIIPKELFLNSSNARLCGIWDEMKKISTSRYCNILSAGLRILLDLAIKDYLDAKNLTGSVEAKYGQTIRDINLKKRLEFLKNSTELTKQLRSDLAKFLNPDNDFSLDVLNGYVHSSKTCFVDVTFLNRFWDFLYPLLCNILAISTVGATTDE